MRILGIDPGYAIVGIGVIESLGIKYKPLACGVISLAVDSQGIRKGEYEAQPRHPSATNFQENKRCSLSAD